MCAIRCRLFLLGYSSNIGYSLAYAFRPASGTAYSSNPRAPSPRVPPVAPCARPAMRDKTFACTPAGPTFDVCRPFDGRQNRRAGNMYRSSRWGAPRLRAAALSSLPACAPSPLAGRNLHLSFHAPAARPRPNALTLIPPGFVLPVVALAPPRFSTARASLIQALSLPCGARFARPYANAFPPPLWAPPTPRKPANGEYEKGGRRE